LRLAHSTVPLEPSNAHHGNTLGAADYRAGRYRDALDTSPPHLQKQPSRREKKLFFPVYESTPRAIP
jgi:hypothetical protein